MSSQQVASESSSSSSSSSSDSSSSSRETSPARAPVAAPPVPPAPPAPTTAAVDRPSKRKAKSHSHSSNKRSKTEDMNDSSSSSRETSPARASLPAPTTAAVEQPSKRKSKSHSHSSNKRSKTEDTNKKSGKQKHPEPQRAVHPPRPTSSKVTAKDIIGTDSDFDEDHQTAGKKDELISYLSRRGSNGVSKQIHPDKQGSRFVDFRLYMCNEIENVTPMNRWRQAIVTLKTKVDDDTPAYKYLVKFLKEIKKDFKDCPVTYSSTPNQ